MRISAILLAAGDGTRFDGGDKLLALLAGVPVIVHAASALRHAQVGELIAVTRSCDEARRRALAPFGPRFIINDAAGQAASLARAIVAVDEDSAGAIVMPADMALMPQQIVERLVDRFVELRGQAVVAAGIDGSPRPPVVWPRALFEDLARLEGDSGGRQLFQRYRDQLDLLEIAAADQEAFTDIDTPDDLARAMRLIIK